MTPMFPELFPLWLFLHVMGAIVAFGFGFVAPVIARMAAAEPEHAGFTVRAMRRVSSTIIVPASISMGVTGVLLVLARPGIERQLWMAVSIALYVLALVLVFAVQRPTFSRLIAATGEGGDRSTIPALVARMKGIGYVLTLLVTVIVALMIWKPTL